MYALCPCADLLQVKIFNSIILDHVVIASGCTIQVSEARHVCLAQRAQNTIICSNAHISTGCKLTDCQVGDSHTVAESSESVP